MAWADAFATTAFVMGDEGLRWLRRFEGYEAVAIRPDGSLAVTDGFGRVPPG